MLLHDRVRRLATVRELSLSQCELRHAFHCCSDARGRRCCCTIERRLAAVCALLKMLLQCNLRYSFTLLLQMHAAVDAVA